MEQLIHKVLSGHVALTKRALVSSYSPSARKGLNRQGDRVKLPVNCCGVLAFVKCTGLRLRGRSPRNPEPGDSYGRILRGLDQEVPSQSHGSARPRADAAFV